MVAGGKLPTCPVETVLKTACPACGASSSLDVLIAIEGAREAVKVALAMPAPLGKLLVQYLSLFRPKQRALSFERVATLLGELQPMIRDGKITRNGRIWSAPQDYWQRALEEMHAKRDKLTLPLKGHGYLLAIIEGYSNKAEAQAEQQHEDRKAGRTQVGGVHHSAPSPGLRPPSPTGRGAGGEGKPRATMPPEVAAALKKLKTNRGDNDDHA